MPPPLSPLPCSVSARLPAAPLAVLLVLVLVLAFHSFHSASLSSAIANVTVHESLFATQEAFLLSATTFLIASSTSTSTPTSLSSSCSFWRMLSHLAVALSPAWVWIWTIGVFGRMGVGRLQIRATLQTRKTQ